MRANSTAIPKRFTEYLDGIYEDAVRDSWQMRRIRFTARAHFNARSPNMLKTAQAMGASGERTEHAYRHRMLRTYDTARIDDSKAADNFRAYILNHISERKASDVRLYASHDTTHITKNYANRQHPAYEKAKVVHDNAKKTQLPGYTVGTTALGYERDGKVESLPYNFEIRVDEEGSKMQSDPNIMEDLILKTQRECNRRNIAVTHIADGAMDSWKHLERLSGVSLVFAERGSRKLTTPTGARLYHDELLTGLCSKYQEELLGLLHSKMQVGKEGELKHEGVQFAYKVGGKLREKKSKDKRKKKTCEWRGVLTVWYEGEYVIRYERQTIRQRFRFAVYIGKRQVERCAELWKKRATNLSKRGRGAAAVGRMKDEMVEGAESVEGIETTMAEEIGSQHRIFKVTCSNDFGLSPEDILLARKRRWNVEEMHRTLKWDRDGIGDGFFMRKFSHIQRHLFLCFLLMAFIVLLPQMMYLSELAIAIWGRRKYKEGLRLHLTGKHWLAYTLMRWVRVL